MMIECIFQRPTMKKIAEKILRNELSNVSELMMIMHDVISIGLDWN